jgi:enamine deaminase RidA (YjgF/YER057c/UK114 family)
LEDFFMPSRTSIRFVRPAELTAQLPCAYAAVTGPGGTVFTAGACPFDKDGNTVSVGDVTAQFGRRWRTSSLTWAPNLTDVVTTTIYVALTDRADLVRAWVLSGRHSVITTLRARCWVSVFSAIPISSSR